MALYFKLLRATRNLVDYFFSFHNPLFFLKKSPVYKDIDLSQNLPRLAALVYYKYLTVLLLIEIRSFLGIKVYLSIKVLFNIFIRSTLDS